MPIWPCAVNITDPTLDNITHTRGILKAFRLDRQGRLGQTQKTAEGYLMTRAPVTRTGVFPYRREDGTVQWELRHPDDVLKPDSLATLGFKPVTNDHPPEDVGPENFSKFSVGTTGQDVIGVDDPKVHDFGFVTVSLILNRRDVLDDLRGGKDELSCGYHCDVEEERGTYQGVPYTARQRNIRYNHLAVVGKGRMNFWDARDPFVKIARADAADPVDLAVQDSIAPERGHGRNRKMDENQRLTKIVLDGGLEFGGIPETVALGVTQHVLTLKRDHELALADLRRDVGAFKDRLAVAIKRADESEEEAKAARLQALNEGKRATEKEADAEAEKGLREGAESDVDRLQAELEAAKAKVVDLTSQLEEAKAPGSDDGQGEGSGGEDPDVAGKLKALDDECKSLRDRIRDMEEENKGLKGANEGMTAKMADQDGKASKVAALLGELLELFLGDGDEEGPEGFEAMREAAKGDALEGRFDRATFDAALNRKANARADLLGLAGQVLKGDALKAAGEGGPTAIRLAILSAEAPKVHDGMTARQKADSSYVRARFDAWKETFKGQISPIVPKVHQDGTPPGDGSDGNHADGFVQRSRGAYQAPGTKGQGAAA